MKCPKCQFDNIEDSCFCSKCGNELEIECPECGKTSLDGRIHVLLPMNILKCNY